MLKLLERNIGMIGRRLVLLAPVRTSVPDSFSNVALDPVRHKQLVSKMQSLRGAVYLNEGNLTKHQLSGNGLHQTPEDDESWHLLMMDKADQVSSCVWYREHENTASLEHLRVRHCPLAQLEDWGDKLKGAVESEIASARRASLRYAEVGGWAVSKDRRCTSEGLMLALAAYGLCRVLGGALGITTANVAHSSSSILRRLGGSYLEHDGATIPAYFDPKYNTHIELLRFDSRRPNAKYVGLIEVLMDKLSDVRVVADISHEDMADGYPIGMSHLAQPMFAG